jgi:hypothetical protein
MLVARRGHGKAERRFLRTVLLLRAVHRVAQPENTAKQRTMQAGLVIVTDLKRVRLQTGTSI